MPKYEIGIHTNSLSTIFPQIFNYQFTITVSMTINVFIVSSDMGPDHFHLKPMAQSQAPDISDLKCKTRVWNRRLCRTLPAPMTSSLSTCIRQSKTFFRIKALWKNFEVFFEKIENPLPRPLFLHIEICLNNLVSKKEEMHLIVDLWNGRSWRRT